MKRDQSSPYHPGSGSLNNRQPSENMGEPIDCRRRATDRNTYRARNDDNSGGRYHSSIGRDDRRAEQSVSDGDRYRPGGAGAKGDRRSGWKEARGGNSSPRDTDAQPGNTLFQQRGEPGHRQMRSADVRGTSRHRDGSNHGKERRSSSEAGGPTPPHGPARSHSRVHSDAPPSRTAGPVGHMTRGAPPPYSCETRGANSKPYAADSKPPRNSAKEPQHDPQHFKKGMSKESNVLQFLSGCYKREKECANQSAPRPPSGEAAGNCVPQKWNSSFQKQDDEGLQFETDGDRVKGKVKGCRFAGRVGNRQQDGRESLEKNQVGTNMERRTEAISRIPAPELFVRDKETVSKFEALYALQKQRDKARSYLRRQSSRTTGVVGTVDVDRVSELVATMDVTIVVTDTGTGKSTLIPKAILDANPDAKIVNTQPRRTPAIKLAERVSSMYGENVGERVGYWVRGEHVGEVGQTPIMYVTNYSLFLHLLHAIPASLELTHIIIDEFHERSVEIEVLLLMIKLVMKRYPGKVKIVLCSATAEAADWATFFEGLKVGQYTKANAMYPVHDYYLEDLSKLIGVSFVKPEIPSNGMMSSIQLQVINFYIKELLKFLADIAEPGDSILVFAPGRTVVEQLTLWIQSNLGDKLEGIAWYRDIDLSYIQEAIERKPDGKKKVYVATDIAEVSITLPDVVFVIDSASVKRPYIDELNTNTVVFPPLQLLWESSVNLRQRRGRVGRVQQGFFFTMMSAEQVPELPLCDCRLTNSVIHEVVLHCLCLTSAPHILFSMCHEEPRKVSVQSSLGMLCDGGYIVAGDDTSSLIERVDNTDHNAIREAWSDLISAEDAYMRELIAGGEGLQYKSGSPPSRLTKRHYYVTLRGLIVGRLPFCVNAGAIVFHGLVTGLTTLSIVAACCVASGSPFYVPYNVEGKEKRSKLIEQVKGLVREYKGEVFNDVVSSVGAVIAYMKMQQDGLSEEGQHNWCEERYLSRMRINDILSLIDQTKEQLAGLVPFEDIDDVDDLYEQYNSTTPMLSVLCSAAFMQQGIYVLHDTETAQVRKFAGSGVFVNINCTRDSSVPTICPWTPNTVCVPFTVHTTYDRLVASFASQHLQEVYNVMLLVFSSTIVFEEITSDTESVVFRVTKCGSHVFLECDIKTATQLLRLRRLMCARLCIMQMLMEREAGLMDVESMASCLQRNGSDFGIPDDKSDMPHRIPSWITLNLGKLLCDVEAGAEAVRSGTNTRPGLSVCRVVSCPPNYSPKVQSALVYSSNGIAPYN